MADQGPATGTGEQYFQTGVTAGVFLEIHSANNVSTPTGSGIPGGLALGASGQNNLGPGDSSGSSPTAYGTVSNGGAVAPVFVNFSNSLVPNVMFRFKNPAAIFFALCVGSMIKWM